MELDAVTLSTIVGAVVTGVLGAMGAGKLRRGKADSGPEESIVTRSEAAALAERARIDAETVGALRSLRDSIEAHDKRDQERHDAILARLKVLGDRSHEHGNKIMTHGVELEHLQEDLRTTRRQLSLDSSVHDVRGR